MDINDFDFSFPKELIATEPVSPRDHCRLMVLNRRNGDISDKYFFDIVDYLDDRHVLVFNDSEVLPARLIGKSAGGLGPGYSGDGSKIEILLLSDLKNGTWSCLSKPAKKIVKGVILHFENGLQGEIMEVPEGSVRIIKFNKTGLDFLRIVNVIGSTPLPPYIKNSSASRDDYQTVYAKIPGSSAAPTAGLHFTRELILKLREKNVGMEFITLHAGLGTFAPVRTKKIEEHKMHSEEFCMDELTAKSLNSARKLKKKIVAVGTTAVRVLESCFDVKYGFKALKGSTNIFIYPGYDWKCVDAIITNFHVPKSTLLMLVSSFAGSENIKRAYSNAVSSRYRFFSFGDAMLIL